MKITVTVEGDLGERYEMRRDIGGYNPGRIGFVSAVIGNEIDHFYLCEDGKCPGCGGENIRTTEPAGMHFCCNCTRVFYLWPEAQPRASS